MEQPDCLGKSRETGMEVRADWAPRCEASRHTHSTGYWVGVCAAQSLLFDVASVPRLSSGTIVPISRIPILLISTSVGCFGLCVSWIMSQFLPIKDQTESSLEAQTVRVPRGVGGDFDGRSRVGARPQGGGNAIHWIMDHWEESNQIPRERRCPTRKESTCSRGETELESKTK
jgi:hypothetical protein